MCTNVTVDGRQIGGARTVVGVVAVGVVAVGVVAVGVVAVVVVVVSGGCHTLVAVLVRVGGLLRYPLDIVAVYERERGWKKVYEGMCKRVREDVYERMYEKGTKGGEYERRDERRYSRRYDEGMHETCT